MWWINCGILCWCRVFKFALAVAAVVSCGGGAVVGVGGPDRGDFHTIVFPLACCPRITTHHRFDNGLIPQIPFFFLFFFLHLPVNIWLRVLC